MGEALTGALLDMEWHALGPDAVPDDVVAFEEQALTRLGYRKNVKA